MATAPVRLFRRRGRWPRRTARGATSRRRRGAVAPMRRRECDPPCRSCGRPGIYAADRMPLERLRRGDPVLAADEDVFTNHIHAEDLADACVAALERGGAQPRLQYLRRLGLADGRHGSIASPTLSICRVRHGRPVPRVKTRLSPMLLSFMGESRRLENARMKRELKLRLRYPTVDDGIAAALDKSNNKGSPHALVKSFPHLFRRQLVRRPVLFAAHLSSIWPWCRSKASPNASACC